jgi:hypothetical protein
MVIVAAPLPPPMLAGANWTLTPAGNEPATSETADLKPYKGTAVICVDPEPPGAKVRLEGPALRLNVGGGVTVNARVIASLTPPVAVIVSEYVPATALAPALNVSTLAPEPGAAMVAGRNAALIPAGRFPADSATAELKPVPPCVVSVTAPAEPAATVSDGALAVKENTGRTCTLTCVVFVWLPPVAVTVNVYVAGATLDATEIVKTLEPDPGADKLAGANAGVIPVGAPVTVSATAALNPPLTVADTGIDPLPPCAICAEAGVAATFRTGAA